MVSLGKKGGGDSRRTMFPYACRGWEIVKLNEKRFKEGLCGNLEKKGFKIKLPVRIFHSTVVQRIFLFTS